MIAPEWKRIAAIHCQEDGSIAAVWIALNKDTDSIHLYDACIFKREVLVVACEGINCRGRWIPVAWEQSAKDIADKLRDKGIKMLPEGYKDSPNVSEVHSRDIWERMRTGRFKVDKRLGEWLEEYKTFYRTDSKVPANSHPLMSATRHAVAQIEYAKRQAPAKKQQLYPKVAIL